MLVSFRHRFVFLANPRCGSTSIRSALAPYADVKESLAGGLHPHACLRSVERHLGRNFDGFAIFTTTRNPWERVVSIYHYGLKTPQSMWHQLAVKAGSFLAFCEHDILDFTFRPKPGSAPIQEGPFDVVSLGTNLRCQSVAKAFDITQMRQLEDWIAKEAGVSVTIPHVNATEHEAYQSYYDDAARKRVAHLFECDIAAMGYTFSACKAA